MLFATIFLWAYLTLSQTGCNSINLEPEIDLRIDFFSNTGIVAFNRITSEQIKNIRYIQTDTYFNVGIFATANVENETYVFSLQCYIPPDSLQKQQFTMTVPESELWIFDEDFQLENRKRFGKVNTSFEKPQDLIFINFRKYDPSTNTLMGDIQGKFISRWGQVAKIVKGEFSIQPTR